MKKLYFATLLLSLPTLVQAQTFAPLVTYPVSVSTYPSALGIGDMNKDGYPDVVTSNAGPNEPAVLLNKKNGTFGAAVLYDGNAHSVLQDVAIGDVTKDGYPEAVVLDFSGTVSLMYNANKGGLSSSLQYAVADRAVAVKLGDVNNDGYLDAVTASLGSSSSSGNSGGSGGVVDVLFNTKQYTFGPSVPYPMTVGNNPYGLDLGDVDGDGYLDVVVAFYESAVGVLLNKKDGTFSPQVTYPTGSSTHPQNIVLGDVNKDGYPDMVATDRTRGTVLVLLNKKDGTFASPSTYALGVDSRPEGVAVGDIDGDGYVDVVTTNFGTNTLGLLLNQKNGTFAAASFLATGSNSQPTDVELSDVNKDGKPDIVFTNYNSTLGVFLNTGVLATQPSAVFAQVQATVHPNPVTGQAPTLTATNLPAEVRSMQATLLNAVGQPVGHLTLPASQGTAHAELPTTGLAPGLYLLQLTACDAQGVSLGALAMQRVSIL